MKILGLVLCLFAASATILPLVASQRALTSATRITLSNKPNSPDWTIISPTWAFVSGKLDGSGLSSLSPKIKSTATFPSDRTFSVKFKTAIQGGVDYYAAWAVGKYVSEYNRTVVILHNSGGLELAVSELGSTGLVDNIYTAPTSLSNLSFHTLKVVYSGNNAKISIDGVLYLNVTDSIIGALGACSIELASWGNSESQFSSATITF